MGSHAETSENPFDLFATDYDQWFDSSRGHVIYAQEIACLRELIGTIESPWLEIGVGTGRFAQALGVKEGVDPSKAVLEIAAGRGIRTRLGQGEDLPYSDASFDGVLMVVTICFLGNPQRALKQCFRILKDDGRLVVGLVPADSPWGELYARKGQEGHRFYSLARFYTCDEVVRLAANAGFAIDDARSCLFWSPDAPVADSSQQKGVVPGAGFVALGFRKILKALSDENTGH